jgi:hypothetical protein
MTTKPEIVKDEHLEYLDDLRESGVTNMFGAAPYVQECFDLTKNEARSILGYWMESSEERHPQ